MHACGRGASRGCAARSSAGRRAYAQHSVQCACTHARKAPRVAVPHAQLEQRRGERGHWDGVGHIRQPVHLVGGFTLVLYFVALRLSCVRRYTVYRTRDSMVLYPVHVQCTLRLIPLQLVSCTGKECVEV